MTEKFEAEYRYNTKKLVESWGRGVNLSNLRNYILDNSSDVEDYKRGVIEKVNCLLIWDALYIQLPESSNYDPDNNGKLYLAVDNFKINTKNKSIRDFLVEENISGNDFFVYKNCYDKVVFMEYKDGEESHGLGEQLFNKEHSGIIEYLYAKEEMSSHEEGRLPTYDESDILNSSLNNALYKSTYTFPGVFSYKREIIHRGIKACYRLCDPFYDSVVTYNKRYSYRNFVFSRACSIRLVKDQSSLYK